MIQPSIKLVEGIRDWLLDYSGILIDRVGNRTTGEKIRQHMVALNISDEEDYLYLLKSQGCQKTRDELISRITVTESFFFRNPDQFRYLAKELLPSWVTGSGRTSFRVWSAGCSTGEEAYSTAYILNWFSKRNPGLRFEVIATDINSSVVERARHASYKKRSIRPRAWDLVKEFNLPMVNQVGDNYEVVDEVKSLVRFKVLNLKDFEGLKSQAGSDIIFCRNVLIYFEEGFRNRLVKSFLEQLNPDGVLFLGETESLPVGFDGVELIKCYGAYGYRKAGFQDDL